MMKRIVNKLKYWFYKPMLNDVENMISVNDGTYSERTMNVVYRYFRMKVHKCKNKNR
jgi:hypothetical protein